jgi:hypothetical protein
LILQCYGHGWITNPLPRGYVLPITDQQTASTSGPCGNLSPDYPETINVTQYESLDVSYLLGNGHDDGGGPSVCRFSIASSESQIAFDQNIVANGITCRDGQDSDTISVPINAAPGIQYLQFNWLAGDSQWYNCLKLNVAAGNLVTTEVSASTVHTLPVEQLNVTQSMFYTVPIQVDDPYRHLLIKINRTAMDPDIETVNVTASVQIRPYTYNSGSSNYLTAQTYWQSFSVCNIAEATQTAYVSVFPSLGYTGNVSFYTKIYEAELDFNTRTELPLITEAGETYVFTTSAYTDAGDVRKIVIDGRGANVYMSGPYGNCVPRYNPTSPDNCVELPVKNPNNNLQKRYYQAYFDNAFNGKVYLQKGVCGGVGTIVISMILLMVVQLFI